MAIEPIQIECRIGPATDRLAYVTGISNSLSKQLANLRYQEIIPDPEMVDRKATYNLPLDAFFMGTRDKVPVYFHVTADGQFERLTEAEFLYRSYKRFESRSVVQPINLAKVIPPVEDKDEEPEFESLAEFSDPHNWNLKPETGNYWRDTWQRYRVLVRRTAGSWAATVFFPKGLTCQGELRKTLDEAKADAWLATLDKLCYEKFPVCTGCGKQEFDDEGCINCSDPQYTFDNPPLLGSFPACLRCEEPVLDPERVLCFHCDHITQKAMKEE